MISLRRSMRIVALAALLALGSAVPAQEIPYTVAIEPESPVSGEVFSVILMLPEISARDIRFRAAGKARGLTLESVTVSPASPGDEGVGYGTRILCRYLPGEPGRLRTPRIELEVAGRTVVLEALEIEVLPAPGTAPRAPYEWRAPSSVMRWQCFPAELRGRGSDAPGTRPAVFPASRGLALEPLGDLAALGIALEEGTIFLPPVRTREGGAAADARAVSVLAAPPEIDDSRAVGEYSARQVKPRKSEARTGETLVFRVEVQGRGNLPILEPPRFEVESPGGTESYSIAVLPVSGIRSTSGGYEGMAGRELRFTPRQAGTYTIQAQPFVFFNPAKRRVEVVRFAPVRLRVEAAASRQVPEGSATDLAPFLGMYASRPGILGEAAARALSGDPEGALELLKTADAPEGLHLKGLALLGVRRPEEALACLARAERLRRFLPGLPESLDLCEAVLEAGARRRDALPEPRIFFLVSVVLLLIGAVPQAVRWLFRKRSGRACPRGVRAAGCVLAAAAALSLLAAFASALERKTPYAVIVREEARAVPSEAGSRIPGAFKGRTGVLGSSSSGWALIRFPDGQAAWFRDGHYEEY